MYYRTRYRIASGKFLLLLILAFVSILGQVVLTLQILKDRSGLSAILWIAAVWLAPPLGPLAYVLFGMPGVSNRMRLLGLLVLLGFALVGFILAAMGHALLH